jgi:hypothetical protein
MSAVKSTCYAASSTHIVCLPHVAYMLTTQFCELASHSSCSSAPVLLPTISLGRRLLCSSCCYSLFLLAEEPPVMKSLPPIQRFRDAAADIQTAAATRPAAASPVPGLYKQILDEHNKHRADHGAPPLAWDDTVAKSAENATAPCVFQHSGTRYGECGMLDLQRCRRRCCCSCCCCCCCTT